MRIFKNVFVSVGICWAILLTVGLGLGFANQVKGSPDWAIQWAISVSLLAFIILVIRGRKARR